MIEGMKPKFFFIRSAAYPNSIFAHNSTVDPEILSELSYSPRHQLQNPLQPCRAGCDRYQDWSPGVKVMPAANRKHATHPP